MVGFGAALRQSKRRGWEEAYVDYESLKLLLTQIEAVYEESATNKYMADDLINNNNLSDDQFMIFDMHNNNFDERASLLSPSTASSKGGGGGTISSASRSHGRRRRRRRKKGSKKKKKVDYRDELFMESDLSVAYASLSDDNDYGRRHDMSHGFNSSEMNHDYNNHDDVEGSNIRQNSLRSINTENLYNGVRGRVGSLGSANLYNGSRGRGGSMGSAHHDGSHMNMMNDDVSQEDGFHTRQRRSNSLLPDDVNFNFSYAGPNYGSTGEISNSIHCGDSENERGTGGDAEVTFSGVGDVYENVGVQHQRQLFDSQYYETSDSMILSPIPNDSTPRHANKQHFDSMQGHYGHYEYDHTPQDQMSHYYQQQMDCHQQMHQHHINYEMWMGNSNHDQRILSQQQKRKYKRHQMKKKKKKKSHVPPHLRIAHAKARAITERFLGLLRAEVDKICLFTHSRMGELTDTCGSLRFPSDQAKFNDDRIEYIDNHLGLSHHPSASSSDDEGPPQSFLPNSSFDGNTRDEEKFVKPPLFPHPSRRKKGALDGTNHRSIDDIFSDEDDSIMHTSAYRHIKIGEELRCAKPTFQRSDNVLGEDFLLMSAVDEADAYTTTGVEFLHLLKFICVNTIAIRKLCRKHDRLLASRMLGGYYYRLKKSQPNSYAISEFRNRRNYRQQQRSGKVEMREHRLSGVYDSMVMSLANNSVAEDLSDSLYLALSEYEVSRQRADALTKLQERYISKSHVGVADVGEGATCFHFPMSNFRLRYANSKNTRENNKVVHNGKEGDDDDLSTSSSISLTRLRFAIASIMSLREAAQLKYEHIDEFFSRTMMAINSASSTVVGEAMNMHSCSSEFLNSLAQYNPDCTLLDDSHDLKRSLTIENNGYFTSYRLNNKSDPVDTADDSVLVDRSERSFNAISTNSQKPTTEKVKKFDDIALRRLNILSIFLTTVNYYIIVPSAASFCAKSHGRYIDSVLLICAPSMAALMGISYHVYRFGNQRGKFQEEVFSKHMLLSMLFPLIGNILYIISCERRAAWLAFLSRFVIGLSSCDTINKEYVTFYVDPKDAAKDIASMRKCKIFGVFVGLFIGSSMGVIEETEVEIYGHFFSVSFESASSYFMFFAWVIQLLFFILSPHPNIFGSEDHLVEANSDIYIDLTTPTASDYEDYHQTSRRHRRLPTDQSKFDYYMKKLERNISDSSNISDPKESTKVGQKTPTKIDQDQHLHNILIKTTQMTLKESALPTTLTLVTFCNITIEMIMSSFIIVTHRYFNWSGSRAGLFLTVLGMLMIPINIAASFWNRRYGERMVLRKSLIIMLVALFIMINYHGLYGLICEMHQRFRQFFEVEKNAPRNYDWAAGVYQYCIGTLFLFASTVLLEGTSLNLMSKVSSEKLNSSAINCNVMIPFIEYLGKVLGCTIVFLVGVSHRLVYVDIVNSIAFFLIVMAVFCRYLVKKHYFFLYGDN